MSSTRVCLYSCILLVVAIGCSGGAEPKKIPTATPEQKAELDKQHAEMKAKTDGGATSAAPK